MLFGEEIAEFLSSWLLSSLYVSFCFTFFVILKNTFSGFNRIDILRRIPVRWGRQLCAFVYIDMIPSLQLNTSFFSCAFWTKGVPVYSCRQLAMAGFGYSRFLRELYVFVSRRVSSVLLCLSADISLLCCFLVALGLLLVKYVIHARETKNSAFANYFEPHVSFIPC